MDIALPGLRRRGMNEGMRCDDQERRDGDVGRNYRRRREADDQSPHQWRTCRGQGGATRPTTNSERYLRDNTGNRRYWPVKVGRFDIAAMLSHPDCRAFSHFDCRAPRDQLWAEAAAVEAKGESIRLDPGLYPDAGREQEKRTVKDPWIEVIGDALGRA
jgi:hypothetical protein